MGGLKLTGVQVWECYCKKLIRIRPWMDNYEVWGFRMVYLIILRLGILVINLVTSLKSFNKYNVPVEIFANLWWVEIRKGLFQPPSRKWVWTAYSCQPAKNEISEEAFLSRITQKKIFWVLPTGGEPKLAFQVPVGCSTTELWTHSEFKAI